MNKSYINPNAKVLLSFLIIIWLFSPLFALGLDESTKADWLILKALRENSLSEIDSQPPSEEKHTQEQRKLISEKETRALSEEDKNKTHLNPVSNNTQQISNQKTFGNSHGLSIGINALLKSTSAEITRHALTIDGAGQQNAIANLSIDYDLQLNNSFSLLFGGNIDLNDNELLNIVGDYKGTANSNFKATEKNHYSLFLAPAYQISKSSQAYLKLAYHSSDVYTQNNIGLKKDNKTLYGYGVGLGLRSHITDNFYGNIEVQRVMYNDNSILSTDLSNGSTIGTVGLSYNFSNEKMSPIAESDYLNFRGLSVGINGQLKSSTMNISDARGVVTNFNSVGEQNINSNISLDYEYKFLKNLVLLEGVNFDLGNTETAKLSGAGQWLKVNEKGHYSFFLAPAYQISYNTLGYVKLAYHHSDFMTDDFLTAKSLGKAKHYYEKGMEGFGLGFGLRTQIYKNIYANAEIQKVVYNSATFAPITLDVDSTIGSVGLSYKF